MAGIAPQITAWSLSRLQTYEDCPYKAYCSYILKIPYVRGPAQIRGEAIHKMAEDYLTGKTRTLKAELANYTEEFKRCRGAAKDPDAIMDVEQQWGLDRNWQPTSWFGKDTWCRVVLDLSIYHDTHLKMVDHKTGRAYDKHPEQMEIYAIAGFNRFPEALTVSGEMWYLDQPQTVVPPLNIEFTRDDLPGLEKKWERRAKPLLSDKRFAPKPGPQCRWCDYQKAKGGPCKY